MFDCMLVIKKNFLISNSLVKKVNRQILFMQWTYYLQIKLGEKKLLPEFFICLALTKMFF